MSHTITMNKKRHTKPCLYFQTQQCPFTAEDCDFAHVYDAAAAAGPDALRSKYRTKPCRYYLQGSCSQGMWCRFKHPVGDWPRDGGDGAEIHDDDAAFDDVPDVRDVDSKWKRQRELHPKYKTRPCRDWLMGKCRRGASCSYLHPAVSPSALPTSPVSYGIPPYVFYPPALGQGGAYGFAPDTDEPSDLDYSGSSSVSGSPPSDQETFNIAHLAPSVNLQQQLLLQQQQPRAVPAARKFSLGSALAPAPPPGVLMQVPIPIVPMYANFYTQSAVTQAVRPRSNSQPPAIQRRKSPGAKSKSSKHTHVPDEHVPPVPALPVNLKSGTKERRPSVATAAPPLPSKPKTGIDEQRDRGFYPITWRVVGGGVKLSSAAEEAERNASQRRSPQEESTPRPKPEFLPAIITPSVSMSSSDGSSEASTPTTPVTAEGTPAQTPDSSPVRPKRGRHAKNLSISIPSPGLLVPLVDGARSDANRGARSTPSSPTFNSHVEIHQLFSAELP